MSTSLRCPMGLCLPISCGSWKWLPMRHSIRTATCTLRAELRPSTCGIWIRGSPVSFLSKRVFSIGTLATLTCGIVGDASSKMKGAWDSIHVLEVVESSKSANYKLTSTVMLYMLTNKPQTGNINLSGSMTRQVPI